MPIRPARFLVLLLASLALSAPALSAEQHLLLDTWSVDVSTVRQPNPPKSVTLTLTDAADGNYRIKVDIEGTDGTVMHAASTFKPGGLATKVQGSSPDVDVAWMEMPNKRTLVMGAGAGGQPASTRVWTLSDDGKQMIETVVRHQPDGTPYTRVFTWLRK